MIISRSGAPAVETARGGAPLSGASSIGSQSQSVLRRWRKYAVWALSVLVVWLVWDGAYRLTGGSELVLASPAATFEALGEFISSGMLWTDLSVSAREFAISFVMASTVGVLVGVLIGYWKSASIALRPWLAAGYSTPLIALTPLFIVWFGLGIWSKVAVGFIVMVFPIIINTALGVSTADKGLIEMMRSLSANQRQVITKVILRGSIPHITTGARIAVGRGVTAIVAAELLGSTAGMGYRILVASQMFDTASILAYVIVLAVIGATLMVSLEMLDARIAERRAN